MSKSELEHDLRQMFIEYGPSQVMASWNAILADFRKALQAIDNPAKPNPVPTITLKNEIVEPVTNPPVTNLRLQDLKPKAKLENTPDKDAQKEKMKAHREAIQKRRQELAAQGVIPETQLTEENLKKWIQQERKNYWTIAEETGCNDTDISNIAKSKSIFSEVAMMIRKKRAKL